MNNLNGLSMLVFNILVFSLLPSVNVKCQCYEAVMDTRNIYVLYEDGDVYTLKYFLNFHGQYTLFEYHFRLSKDDAEIQLTETVMTITRQGKNFQIRSKSGNAELIVKLGRKNCKRLKVNKIPEKNISKWIPPG